MFVGGMTMWKSIKSMISCVVKGNTEGDRGKEVMCVEKG